LTNDGLIGMGLSWSSRGNRVMLVRGTIASYIFRHVDDDLRFQTEKLKKGDEKAGNTAARAEAKITKNSKQPWIPVDTRKEIAKPRLKLIQLEGQIGRKYGWVLMERRMLRALWR